MLLLRLLASRARRPAAAAAAPRLRPRQGEEPLPTEGHHRRGARGGGAPTPRLAGGAERVSSSAQGEDGAHGANPQSGAAAGSGQDCTALPPHARAQHPPQALPGARDLHRRHWPRGAHLHRPRARLAPGDGPLLRAPHARGLERAGEPKRAHGLHNGCHVQQLGVRGLQPPASLPPRGAVRHGCRQRIAGCRPRTRCRVPGTRQPRQPEPGPLGLRRLRTWRELGVAH
mmetsp:Transcript_26041/g.76361  ORF Transcript_26041/g.76361 Transcript_26041/m.76361 type:complete len:229 (+) Transcript_26041:867-1553(+)